MPVGFGGAPPLVSVLTGFAKGVTEVQKRKEERQRQAMIDALRKAQDQRARRQLDLAEQREARAQSQFEQRQDLAEQEAEADEAEADRRAEYVRARVPELVDAGFSQVAAIQRAGREAANEITATPAPQPEEEDPMDALREKEARLRIQDRERDIGQSEAEDAILSDRAAREAIEGAQDEDDAEAFYDAHTEAGKLEGVSKAEFMRIFRERQGGREEDTPAGFTQSEIRDRARVRVANMLRSATPAVALGQAPLSPEVAQRAADARSRQIADILAQNNDLTSPEIAMLNEMLDLLARIGGGDFQDVQMELRRLGIGGG